MVDVPGSLSAVGGSERNDIDPQKTDGLRQEERWVEQADGHDASSNSGSAPSISSTPGVSRVSALSNFA